MFFAKTINSMINFPYLIQNKCKKKNSTTRINFKKCILAVVKILISLNTYEISTNQWYLN